MEPDIAPVPNWLCGNPEQTVNQATMNTINADRMEAPSLPLGSLEDVFENCPGRSVGCFNAEHRGQGGRDIVRYDILRKFSGNHTCAIENDWDVSVVGIGSRMRRPFMVVTAKVGATARSDKVLVLKPDDVP